LDVLLNLERVSETVQGVRSGFIAPAQVASAIHRPGVYVLNSIEWMDKRMDKKPPVVARFSAPTDS
jgi:hypothetical protein